MSTAAADVRASPLVATVGARATRASELTGPAFANVGELLAARDATDAVVLTSSSPDELQAWATALRRDPRYALRPVFTTGDIAPHHEALLDGHIDSTERCLATIDAIAQRCSTLARDATVDPSSRLLAYLVTRPDTTLTAHGDWRHASLYHYPLLDAFDPDANQSEWLSSLLRRQLIEPVRLLDRVRHCPSCDGAHLSYTDLCGSCGSVDISEQIFLHCYTCGHVATQASYLRADAVQCPKCQARLRHIGVDYDRALETFSCASCASRFAEPDIKARCLHCHMSHATTDLVERRIEAYRLSAAGALAARTGQIGELFSLVDGFNYAHPSYFERTLEWQMDVRRRHPEVQFGLLCVELVNLRVLVESATRARAVQLIDAFVTRLRELVRTTDLVCRTDETFCWLLLPQTPPDGVAVLQRRIEELPRLTARDGGPVLEIAVRAFASRDLGTGKVPAPLLMSELKAPTP